MKKLKYLLALVPILFLSCADDFLDTKSRSKHDVSYVYSSLSFTENAMNGIYAMLTDSYIYGQKISTNWPTNSDIEFAGLSDDPKPPTRDAGASNYYASELNQNLKWNNIYKLNELATTAVEGIRNSPLLQTSDSVTMKAYLGEALTLRALSYFELVKFFGDVPFKEGPTLTDLSNIYIGRVDRDTIYKHIVDDLLEAQQYVPWQGESAGRSSYSNPEKISKGFIKGLAARVALFAGGWSLRDRNLFPDMDIEVNLNVQEMNGYVVGRTKDWKRYYEIAAQQTAEIIGSAENPHGLQTSYEDFWKSVNALTFSSANESLFEVAFGVGNSGDIGSLIGMNLAAGSKQFGGRGTSGGNVKTSAYYFYSFNPQDTRRDVTVINITYTADDKEKFEGSPYGLNFGKWRIYWMSDTYKELYKVGLDGRVSTGINWILMRYSDVLLMFAEAQNELYGADVNNAVAGMTARNALEKVRTRAFGQGHPSVTQYDSDFFEAIVNERAWEFGGEAVRKYDLLRWGILSERIEIQKQALCQLLDGKGNVKIFDRSYDVTTLPNKIFYKLEDNGMYIDRSSINYYDRLDEAPTSDYTSVDWLNGGAVKGTNMRDWVSRILIASTGLNASYDYTSFTSGLDSATVIQEHLATFTIGNGVCNYRHPYSIFTKNIVDSRGTLFNSYGY